MDECVALVMEDGDVGGAGGGGAHTLAEEDVALVLESASTHGLGTTLLAVVRRGMLRKDSYLCVAPPRARCAASASPQRVRQTWQAQSSSLNGEKGQQGGEEGARAERQPSGWHQSVQERRARLSRGQLGRRWDDGSHSGQMG